MTIQIHIRRPILLVILVIVILLVVPLANQRLKLLFKAMPEKYQALTDLTLLSSVWAGGGGGGQDPLRIVRPTNSLAVLRKLDDVFAVEFSFDGRYMVSKDAKGISLWGTDREDLLAFWEEAYNPVFIQNGSVLAMGNKEGAISLFEIESRTSLPPFQTEGLIYTEQLSPDGQLFIEGTTIRYAQSGMELSQLNIAASLDETAKEGCATAIETKTIISKLFSPDTKLLLTTGPDGTARLWETKTGRQVRCLEFEYKNSSYNIETMFSSDGKGIGLFDGDSTIYIWDIATGLLAYRRVLPDEPDLTSFSPDLKSIITGNFSDNIVKRWDITTGQLNGYLRHPGGIRSIKFSNDGNVIIVEIFGPSLFWLWNANHEDVEQAAFAETITLDGIKLAIEGNLRSAEAQFKRAQRLNPYREYNIEIEGGKRVLEILEERNQLEQLSLMLTYSLKKATQFDKTTITVGDWHTLCTVGIELRRFGDVVDACDLTVKTVLDISGYVPNEVLENRGIVRSMTGDIYGATEDFQSILQNSYETRLQLQILLELEALTETKEDLTLEQVVEELRAFRHPPK